MTALHMAVMSKSQDTVLLLQEANVDPRVQSKEGKRAVDLAADQAPLLKPVLERYAGSYVPQPRAPGASGPAVPPRRAAPRAEGGSWTNSRPNSHGGRKEITFLAKRGAVQEALFLKPKDSDAMSMASKRRSAINVDKKQYSVVFSKSPVATTRPSKYPTASVSFTSLPSR